MPALQRLALVVIHLALPASEREWIIGDVMEEFELIARRDGAAAANRWLRHEAIRAAAGAYRLRAVLGRPATPPRGESPMRNLFQDVRYTGRLLRRSPGFTAVAALTLAVGIGANAAIFSIVHAVLLAPLPYANPDQLVRLYDASEEEPRWPMAPGNFHEYRSHARSLEALAAYERGDLQLEGERPEPLRGMRVTPGFFSVMGWSPILGRDFRPDEEAPGGEDVAILSHGLWQRRFSSDPSVVGQSLTLSGRPFRIVGVLPAGFQHVGSTYRSYPHGNTVDIWWVRTLRPVPLPQDRNQHYLNVVGRLRSDVTFARAQQELTSIAERLAREYPNSNGSWRVRLAPLREEIVGATAPILLMLLAAVQLVLLLACVNVAGLLVGRASQRTREIGVRAALGATRTRLVRQLVVESLVLAAGGGAIGVAFAAAAVRALPLIAPADMPRLDGLTLQWTVVLYAVGMMGVTALLFGLLPAVQLARSAVNDTLRGGGRGVTAGSNPRLRSTLVAAEIALAFLLVAGAGLLFRSFENLTASEPGFRSAGVLTARVGLPQARYRNTAEAAAFFERLRDRIAVIPGVQDVGLGSDLPWTGYDENTSFGIIGRAFPPRESPAARFHMVTPGYFAALGVPLAAGRDFTPADRQGALRVVLVNRTLACRFWEEPTAAIGMRLDLWGETRTVIGVVGDVRDTPWAAAAEPALYFPQAQEYYGQDMLLTVRTVVEPMSLVADVTAAVQQIDPALPLANVHTLESVTGAAFAMRRLLLILVGAFGATALFLASVGVYGVTSQAVERRAAEFGVRQAFGAAPGDILRLVLKGTTALTVAGTAVGAVIAGLSTRLLGSVLFGVSPLDPITFGSVAAILLAVGLGAAYPQAWRATRTDPASVLRGNT